MVASIGFRSETMFNSLIQTRWKQRNLVIRHAPNALTDGPKFGIDAFQWCRRAWQYLQQLFREEYTVALVDDFLCAASAIAASGFSAASNSNASSYAALAAS